MAGPVKKSTKKFEHKKLKGELERRNARKQAKQKYQLAEKRKAKRAPQENGDAAEKEPKKGGLQEMTMDDFFQGGFEIAESKPKKPAKKRKREAPVAEAEESEASSVESLEQNPVEPDSDEGSELENEDDVAVHKKQLEALAENDPEFYKWAQENDAELLDFSAGNDMAEDEEEPPRKKSKGKGETEPPEDDEESMDEDLSGATEITADMVAKWKKNMVEQHSLTALHEVVLAFRAAVHTSDDDNRTFKYSVSSPEIYHKLLVAALEQVPGVLNHHLPVKETASGKTRISTDSKKFSKLSPTLNTYTNAILSLLSSLSDAPTLKLTLTSLMPLLPYILSFKKLVKNLTKAVVGIWADHSNSEAVRINAFLVVRRLGVIGDGTIREGVLRSSYQALVRSSRGTTTHTLAAINLMKNAAVELWGLDASLAYTTGFAAIRQLAVHLRQTITQPAKDSYKAVYNWQYVHSLDFWSRVLARHCSPDSNPQIKKASDSPLHPLVYPLVQITLGALRLIPTPTYFPLRFHLTRSLLRISRATRTYIPLAPPLLEVLQSPELRNAPKPGTQRALDFSAVLRAPKAYLRSRIYQDGLGEQVVALLAEFFGIWANNIAYPELIIPPTVLLKRWLKDVSGAAAKDAVKRTGPAQKVKRRGNANGKLNAAVLLLVQKLNANASFVEQRRMRTDFAVGDRRAVDAFLADTDWEDLPLGAYVAGLRRQQEERERALAEGRQDGAGRREKEARDAVEQDDDSEDGDANEAWDGDDAEDDD